MRGVRLEDPVKEGAVRLREATHRVERKQNPDDPAEQEYDPQGCVAFAHVPPGTLRPPAGTG